MRVSSPVSMSWNRNTIHMSDSEEGIKHLELDANNAEKVTAEFDDKTGNVKVATEIGTRYSDELTQKCPSFNPSNSLDY